MARVLMLLTTTPGDDRRSFRCQAPALASGHELVYACGADDVRESTDFEHLPLSVSERKWARRTGGLNLLPRAWRLRPDVVLLCSVEQLPLGLALKWLRRCAVVYDNREDMVSSMLYSKVRFPRWQRRILAEGTRALEWLAAISFDGIVTADPGTAALHRAMPESRKLVFYNTALLREFGSDHPPLADRAYDVVLLGGMGRRSGGFLLLDALGALADRGRPARALFVGDVPDADRAEFEARVAELGIDDSVRVTGRVDPREVPALLSDARIGVVALLDDPKFHRNIACKAFEYMACRMPVVSPDLPPERLFLEHGENALLFPPGDAAALAAAIETLLGDLDRAQRMGDRGRADAESEWNAEREQAKLLEFLDRILAPPGDRIPIRGGARMDA